MDKFSASIHKELKTAKGIVWLTSALILVLLTWQFFSTSISHKAYQQSLMESVTDRVISDYQEYLDKLRLEIDLFQSKHQAQINKLELMGEAASEEDYMVVYKALKSDLQFSRLFALIGAEGEGILKHITGDFLPACKEEIASTLDDGEQEQLFLHRTATSVHFDLLQPLFGDNQQGKYFFVAFNPNVLQSLLAKYQLPHQQLFLLHSENRGKIELTTERPETDPADDDKKRNLKEEYEKMTLTKDQITSFSYLKKIPKTRWQLAIKLDDEYNRKIYTENLTTFLLVWLILTSVIYTFYRAQKTRLYKQAALKQQLEFKELHDNLTGLSNRTYFKEQLDDLLKAQHQKVNQSKGVVLHIDVDQFQVINNSYGYSVGDKILANLSKALLIYLPPETLLSRLGNDEYSVLLPNLNHDNAKEYANKIRTYINHINLSDLDFKVNVTTSIGVVILDGSQNNAEQILSGLSLSVALAKQKGRNRVQIYQSEDSQLQQHALEMKAVHHLNVAIKEERLTLYRQEIKQLQTSNSTKHYEVLVRIKSTENKLISPAHFIPAAEKYGAIKPLDRKVIELTLKALSERPEDKNGYSINLSGTTLADREASTYVKQKLEFYNIAPERICFEVTETSAISHLETALKFIREMKKLGCLFSLDDFGSGLSSYSYLQQLPVDIIKIDGVFVRDIDANPVNRIFVENMQRTAEAMNKKIVAEFVENESIINILTSIGVDYGQGYHIHQPEPWYN